MEGVQLRSIDDCRLVVEENLLAVGKRIEDDCSGVA